MGQNQTTMILCPYATQPQYGEIVKYIVLFHGMRKMTCMEVVYGSLEHEQLTMSVQQRCLYYRCNRVCYGDTMIKCGICSSAFWCSSLCMDSDSSRHYSINCRQNSMELLDM
jgi:hypothetical protein